MSISVAGQTVPNEYFTAVAYEQLREIKNMRGVKKPFAEAVFSKGVEKVEGGYMFTVPFEMNEHSRPTRVTAGNSFGTYDTWSQPTMTSGSDVQGYIVQPVFISGYEKTINRGKAQQVNIIKTRTKNVYDHLLRQAERAFLVGATSSGSHPGVDSWQDFNDLNGTDRSTGFIEEDSSGGNTIHGVSRSTYPATTHPRFHNIAADVANSASTNLLDRISTVRGQMEIRGLSASGSFMWFCTNTFQTNLGKVLRGGLQYFKMSDGEQQTMKPILLGKELTVVEELPYQGTNSATYKWSCVGVNFGEGIHFRGQSGCILDMTPFADVPGTVGVQSALYHLFGQLCSKGPGDQILFHRAETYS